MRYVFYDPTTGELHPEVKELNGLSLSVNTPKGYMALEHPTAKPRHHRVDLTTGTAHPAPPPTPEHEWNEKGQQWELSRAAAERAAVLRAARTQLAELDLASIRPLRALVLGCGRETDRQKLKQIEEEAAAARSVLSGKTSSRPAHTVIDESPVADR